MVSCRSETSRTAAIVITVPARSTGLRLISTGNRRPVAPLPLQLQPGAHRPPCRLLRVALPKRRMARPQVVGDEQLDR